MLSSNREAAFMFFGTYACGLQEEWADAKWVIMGRKIESFVESEVGNPRPLSDVLLKMIAREGVIVSCSVLDTLLADLIATALRDDKKAIEEFLGLDADGRAPLGSFGARIQGAYLLRLIEEVDYEILKCIKRIRNAFAHRVNTSFGDEQVVMNIKRIMDAFTNRQFSPQPTRKYRSIEHFLKAGGDRPWTPHVTRDWFMGTVVAEMKMLHSSCRRRKGGRKRRKG